MQIELNSHAVFPTSSFQNILSNPQTVKTIKKRINDVIDGKSQEALISLDLSKPKSNIFFSRQICQKSSQNCDPTSIFMKITRLKSEDYDHLLGCRIAFSERDQKNRTQKQFAEQDIYMLDGKKFSILQRLVAPSFGGKKAVEYIKDTTKALDIPILYLSDGSLISTQKCCKRGSLISLRLYEIFKYGQTWYERQGAKVSSESQFVNYNIFKFIYENVEEIFDFKFYKEEYLKTHYLTIMQKVQDEYETAFSKSKKYLHNLTVKSLLMMFEDYKNHPILGEIYLNVEKASQLTNLTDEVTLGELMDALLKLDPDNEDLNLHTFKHDFLESVISFNYKYLLAYYCERLLRPKNLESLFLTIVLSVTFFEQFLGYYFDLVRPYLKRVSSPDGVIEQFLEICLTADSAKLKDFIDSEVKQKASALSQKAVKIWETQTDDDFMDFYYFNTNHSENLELFLTQFCLGPSDFDITFFIIILFNHLKNISISQLESLAPSFSSKVNSIVGEKVFSPGSSKPIAYFIKNIRNDQKLLHKTINVFLNYLLQSGKFFPSRVISELAEEENSIDHFFLAKMCAFSLGPFEFQLQKKQEAAKKV